MVIKEKTQMLDLRGDPNEEMVKEPRATVKGTIEKIYLLPSTTIMAKKI